MVIIKFLLAPLRESSRSIKLSTTIPDTCPPYLIWLIIWSCWFLPDFSRQTLCLKQMDFVQCVSQSPNDSERSVTTRILLQWINKIYFTVSLFSLFFSLPGDLLLITIWRTHPSLSRRQKKSKEPICQSYFTFGRSRKPQSNKCTWCDCNVWLFTESRHSTLSNPHE